MRFGRILVSTVVAAALTFAACGDGKDDEPTPTAVPSPGSTLGPLEPAPSVVSVEDFVEAVCVPWTDYYAKYLELYNAPFAPSTQADEHKRKLLELTRAMEATTHILIDAIPGIPAPQAETANAGLSARQVIINFFRQEQKTFATYVAGVEALDTSDNARFLEQLQKVTDSAPPNNVEVELEGLPSPGPEVRLAIDSRPDDCAKIFIAF